MKRVLFALLACFAFAGVAHTEERVMVNVDGKLNSEQMAQLQLKASELIKENKKDLESLVPPVTAAAHVKEWVDIGAEIGSGLASTAQKLGVATNDFANTNVGRITTMVIVWHFIGSQLVHVVFGVLILLVGMPTWLYVYRRTWFVKTITTYEAGKGPSGASRVVKKTSTDKDSVGEGTAFALWLAFILVLAISTISVFSF